MLPFRRTMTQSVLLSVVLTSALIGFSTACKAQSESIDYQVDVRPILSNHCFACHGFDEDSRAADLRLDIAPAVAASLDSAGVTSRDASESAETSGSPSAIVPGKPSESEVVRRIESNDPDLQMPPPSSNKPLSARDKQIIARWIEQGARYESHWAFKSFASPHNNSESSVPKAVVEQGNLSGSLHPIDSMVRHRLAALGLPPSPRADSSTLLRRLYLDLVGTLPTPEAIEEFQVDDSADAVERVVDELLSSPQFGERWGRFWLDQARYADSNGFTIDGARVMWPYRDWVISALNADMPFDQFTREQLAGDLLPDATKLQRIASAFHRNTMINEEGGVKADQYRHEAIIDRVNTTGAVWLGLTVGCAQCHTHKYDPISIDDYYRLYAFFNACADSNSTAPTIEVLEGEVFGLPPSVQKDLEELKKLQRDEAAMKAEVQAALADDAVPALDWKPIAALHALGRDGDRELPLERLEDGSLRVPKELQGNSRYQIEYVYRPEIDAKPITAVRLRAIPDASLPNQGPGTAGNGNFVLTEIEMLRGDSPLSFSKAWASHSQPKYPIGHAIDSDAKSGWAINVDAEQVKAKPGLKMNTEHTAVFALKDPLAPSDTPIEIFLHHDLNDNYLIGRFALEYSTSTIEQQREAPTKELAQVEARLAEIRGRLPNGGKSVAQMVSKDMEKPAATYRLERGDFLSPDKSRGELPPNIPEVFAQGRPEAMQTRLDLANWLVSERNPLTARVMVNRVWMRLFGVGLVETENDFGFQGAAPTHPELLDSLARQWVQTGWSLKGLIRSIVTSATYQQSSKWREDVERVDAGNKFLARQSRIRVDAELVRDQALSAAGVLEMRVGGPSVHPPQPAGVYNFTQTPKTWKEDTGANRYRKTMYTEFFRSAPYPLFTTFDAPDFSNVCTRRSRTNTPLQALTVANDKVFSELAMFLVDRSERVVLEQQNVIGELPVVSERIDWMMRFALCRRPTKVEAQRLEDFYLSAKETARQNPSDVQTEKMAWFQVARVLLNTDEFLNRE